MSGDAGKFGSNDLFDGGNRQRRRSPVPLPGPPYLRTLSDILLSLQADFGFVKIRAAAGELVTRPEKIGPRGPSWRSQRPGSLPKGTALWLAICVFSDTVDYMVTVNVCETFTSIQGESSYVGLSCFFIRLSGCNLRCKYCDTPQASGPGKDVVIPDLVADCAASSTAIVEVTGGEPLLQPGFRDLAARLRDNTGKPVLVETNGSRDISVIPDGVITIMDVKCPGSGEDQTLDLLNIERLRPKDEVKFVISGRDDYDWAKAFVRQYSLTSVCHAVFFSPVFGVLDARELGEWIVEDGLPVRLGVQLHKIVGMM